MLPKTAKDIAGQKFTRLTAVSYMGPAPDARGSLWLFVCECGAERELVAGDVRRGAVKSCGCLHRDTQRKRMTKHGQSRTAAYQTWNTMKMRCLNPKNPKYKDYGGRGIGVCQRWIDSFEAFHDDMGPRPPGGELERVDNSGHYCPENCRWATRQEQCQNTRRTRLITVNGVTKCLTAWAAELGVHPVSIHLRIKRGWPPELAVTTPKKA